MAPCAQREWSVEYDILRRERLFRHPPKDQTAYPSLAAAILPHIHSFNALFDGVEVLKKALEDIGTKSFLDGDRQAAEHRTARREERRPPRRNKLDVRITELFLEKAVLPTANKFSTRNREIYPAECRERHATYRGKLRARLEYRINNGDWKESVRELGQVPIMLRVSFAFDHKIVQRGWTDALMITPTDEQVPPREMYATSVGPVQRRIRRAWWLFYCQWQRKAHSDVDRYKTEFSNGNGSKFFH